MTQARLLSPEESLAKLGVVTDLRPKRAKERLLSTGESLAKLGVNSGGTQNVRRTGQITPSAPVLVWNPKTGADTQSAAEQYGTQTARVQGPQPGMKLWTAGEPLLRLPKVRAEEFTAKSAASPARQTKTDALDQKIAALMEDPNFETYVQTGLGLKNPSFEDAQYHGWFGLDHEEPKNIVTFSRDNMDRLVQAEQQSKREADLEGSSFAVVGNSLYRHMTDDEVKTHAAFLGRAAMLGGKYEDGA